MGASDVKILLAWELGKYAKRGYWNIPALLTFISFFIYFPQLLFYILSCFPDISLYLTYTIGTYTVHMAAYLLGNSAFFIMYYLNWPMFERFKISSEPWPWQSNPDFPKAFKDLLKLALFNQIITVPITLFFTGLKTKYQVNLIQPELQETILQIGIFILIEDFCFYWSHRVLHIPFLYKRIHKTHHEYNVSISAAAEYAHPLEYLLGNSLPLAAGPFIYGQGKIHIVTWLTWVFFRTLTTCEGHSGYEVPWSPFRYLPLNTNSSYHDYHHLTNQGNFSSFTIIWDTLMQTNKKFWKSVDLQKSQ